MSSKCFCYLGHSDFLLCPLRGNIEWLYIIYIHVSILLSILLSFERFTMAVQLLQVSAIDKDEVR